MMRKIKKSCYLFFLFLINILNYSKAQDRIDSTVRFPEIKFGLRVESNRILEKRLENFSGTQPAYKLAFVPHSGYVFPVSLYLYLQYNIDNDWSAEFRPGILFAGEHLTSLSLSLHGKYYIYKRKSYVMLGLDNTRHIDPYTFGEDGELRSAEYQVITAHNDNEFHTAIVVGIGMHLSKVFSADISFSRPFKEEYGWHEIKDLNNRIDLPDGKYPMKVYGMLKIGVNITIL